MAIQVNGSHTLLGDLYFVSCCDNLRHLPQGIYDSEDSLDLQSKVLDAVRIVH
jgi:hypothetical protein